MHRRIPVKLYKRLRGITLIELMIVVSSGAILVVVAYPNYRQFVQRAKRNEAKAPLLQIAQMQERFYLNNNTYTTDMTQLGFGAAGGVQSDSGAYTIDVTAADANNFSAQAVYNLADEEAAKCSQFNIDGRGVRTSAPLPDCWTRTR